MSTPAVQPPTNIVFADRNFKYLLVAPAIFMLLVVGLFPFIYTLLVSFQNITLIEQDYSFSGFLHYARLFEDWRLWEAILHTAVFTAIALPLELIFGLLLARLFLNDLPLKSLFVGLLVIPAVISPIVAGSMWKLIFDHRYGPINQIISWILGEPVTILWTVSPQWVYPAIIICEVWEWTPFMFLILLAALSNVDRSLIEAAEIDGASFWKVFIHISLPSIWPVMVIALIIRALDLVRLFEIVFQLTRGGPGNLTETISIYMYIKGFQQFETSYMGALVFLVILLLTAIVMFALSRVEIAR
jgi:multiple sugar transport system permease protein